MKNMFIYKHVLVGSLVKLDLLKMYFIVYLILLVKMFAYVNTVDPVEFYFKRQH